MKLILHKAPQGIAKDVPAVLKASQKIVTSGPFWICYRKGGSKAETDLNRDVLWNMMVETTSLRGVNMIAIDDIWAAMRFAE